LEKQVVKIFANCIAFYLASIILNTVKVDSLTSVFIAGVILWLVNLIIRPILIILTLPVNIITLGIFSLIINTWMVMLAGSLTKGIHISGFVTSFIIAIFISLLNMLFKDFH
jgi:putative membrane protein